MKLLYLVESGESKFLVFDEMPDKISTKYGDDTIIGRIGGIFYDFLAKRNERREAFGGRKFDIVLDNGEIEKCEGQWRAVSAMHRGAEFRHGLVEDITGHQWSLNRYENDLLTAGCHRIAYNEMERIAKQLGWV